MEEFLSFIGCVFIILAISVLFGLFIAVISHFTGEDIDVDPFDVNESDSDMEKIIKTEQNMMLSSQIYKDLKSNQNKK